MEYTITEGLADVKTIKARLNKKRTALMHHLTRDSRTVDPFVNDGLTQSEFVTRERQAINDLNERILKIRRAIQIKNQETPVEIEGRTMSLQDWLNWRREISKEHRAFLSQMLNLTVKSRTAAQNQGQAITTTPTTQVALIVNLSEKELMEEIEKSETILGTLDGRLSLLNATLKIDI